MKPNGYEYINDLIFYIVNELTMIHWSCISYFTNKKVKEHKDCCCDYCSYFEYY